MSDVAELMKRCQRGVGGRNALDEAHDIMAECYGTLGRLESERDTLRQQLADYAALEAERERLRQQVATLKSDANSWQSGYDKGREDGAKAAEGWKGQHARDSAELRRLCAERDTLRQQRDKLAQALENVEREHELIRQMKNCELRRGRGSFGIAVMSDAHAIEWQALDKELQQLIDARRAALAEPTP